MASLSREQVEAALRFKDFLLTRDMQLLALQKEGFRPVSTQITNEEMNQVLGDFVAENGLVPDLIKASHPQLTLSSSHVGSMGGLMAIKRGVCHLAGSHLLDPQDGTYNLSYVKKFLAQVDVKLINLVLRDQGLIIRRGNPKNIKGIDDLARSDISFINRQAGSGTRILLDFRLNKLGIDPAEINGYHHEEFTHMAVAVAVLSGTVDAGLGIQAAATALDLDFIPVVTEQYDLIIPTQHFETDNIQLLLEIINSQNFKKRVEALGGYNAQKAGNMVM